jgi:hypothetical protein
MFRRNESFLTDGAPGQATARPPPKWDISLARYA